MMGTARTGRGSHTQIYAQLITAPTPIREKYGGKASEKRLAVLGKLKRAIVRESSESSPPVAVPGVDDPSPLRQAKNVTLTSAANQLGVWPTTISEFQRGIRRNDDLAQSYREWLLTA